MTLAKAPLRIRTYWNTFDPRGDLAPRFYEPFRVGFDDAHADAGARLVLAGRKSTTSSLLWEYEDSGRAPPRVGALSVLMDGGHRPVCVVETTQIEVIAFEDVPQPFCAAYGECDGTVGGWRAMNWPIFEAQCHAMGRQPDLSMPLVCESFRVFHPAAEEQALKS